MHGTSSLHRTSTRIRSGHITPAAAYVQLPTLTRAVEFLKMDYRRHHYVFFNPDFEMFLRDTKTALDAHQLPHRVFDEIFSDTNLTPHPSCNGSAFPLMSMRCQLRHPRLSSI